MRIAELSFIYPELLVASAASIILLIGVYFKRGAYVLSLVTLLAAVILTLAKLPTVSHTVFADGFVIDRFANLMKISLFLLLALIFIYAKNYMTVRKFMQTEFFVLSLFSMLGMMVLISSRNFLSMYLGLELLVLPLYALIVMVRDQSRYAEAAIKYFVIGSMGAGILLYGISFVYGATGSFEFAAVMLAKTAPLTLQLGLLFVISGIALEFAAVPFHMWLPDVYEGSPTAVTMLIGTLPKIAIFVITYRLLTEAFGNLDGQWMHLLLALSLLSIAIGNVLAIAQDNIKRMLAYSTIGHIGFILLGLFTAPAAGFIATIYYVLVYVFMVLAAFGVIIALSKQAFEAEFISDYRGLAKRKPWLAFMMLLIMLSLAGVPPLLGFYAKFLILQNVVIAGYPLVAIFALVFTVIGSFYYLRIIRAMYFEDLDDTLQISANGSITKLASILLSAHSLLLLVLGIVPGVILSLCVNMLGS